MSADYEAFIASKSLCAAPVGLEALDVPAWVFPHQAALVRWALRKGRSAVFADTGLGKTGIELVWAHNVAQHARGRVLILAPLAVAHQIEREGETFGIPCPYARVDNGAPVVVTNYEMLHAFDPRAFVGVVLDESGILKSFDGATRSALIAAFGSTPYRLCATATPAPNDFTELGNHSEFLGIKSRAEMLAEYFVHDGSSTQDWRIKGHAVLPFWRWVASWGAVVKSPEDLGFDGSAYQLPPLEMHEHVVHEELEDAHASGLLFPEDARSLSDQRRVRRATMGKRVAMAVDLSAGAEPCIVWCELNDEADACERAIEGSVQVSGSDSADEKVRKLLAFLNGEKRVLVSKAQIVGFGINMQVCARMVFVGASHSYEQTYQAIRRCWRFGQKRPVDVHVIRADTERFVIENYRRKEADAARLAVALRDLVGVHVRNEVVGASAREWNAYAPLKVEVPSWL
ncbi:MAG TPA: helicase-related protein [Polyangiales bacterium]|nr:helicase-related protein [Polyangiales bacterium]